MFVHVQKDSKEPIARSTVTTAIRIRVRMAELAPMETISILALVQKDSKEPTARATLTTALRIPV
jgi:hypothetical protein